MDNLLRLIEKGDMDTILSDEELLPKLNELIKYELVIIKGETVILSDRGQEAKNIGVDEALKKAKSKNTIQNKNLQDHILTYKRSKNSAWFLGFFILLIILILLFLFLQ